MLEMCVTLDALRVLTRLARWAVIDGCGLRFVHATNGTVLNGLQHGRRAEAAEEAGHDGESAVDAARGCWTRRGEVEM